MSDDGSTLTLTFKPYEQIQATKTMTGVPRFGHSDKFADLFGTKDETSDYIVGLLFAGVFICACFLAYYIILMVLKCLGPSKVGFMSGAPFQIAPGKERRPKIFRGVFLLSAVVVILFSILFVTEGLTNLYNTVDTMNYSAVLVNGITQQTLTLAADFKETRNETLALRIELESELSGFCGSNPNLFEETGVDFRSIAEKGRNLLMSLGDLIGDDIRAILETIDDVEKSSSKFIEETNDVEIDDWQSLIIIIPYTLITCLLMVAVLLAHYRVDVKWYRCLTRWVFLPLFIIMMILAFVVCAAIAIAASANADFCSGGDDKSPKGTLEEVLIKNGADPNELTYRMVQFFVSRCDTEDPFLNVREFNIDLDGALEPFQEFVANATTVGAERLQDLCVDDNIGATLELVGAVVSNLGNMLSNLVDFLRLLTCDGIVPILINTFDKGTCQYSVKGATWMFAAFLVVAIFGTIMITFRSSMLFDEEDNEKFWIEDEIFANSEELVEKEDEADQAIPMEESFLEDELYVEDSAGEAVDNVGEDVAEEPEHSWLDGPQGTEGPQSDQPFANGAET